MFKLKKYNLYNTMSESKKILEGKTWFIDIQEHYGNFHILEFRLYRKEKDDLELYVSKHWLKLPLNFYSFYILYIYSHLGKCHPNLRSKFYIGKPIELTWKEKE